MDDWPKAIVMITLIAGGVYLAARNVGLGYFLILVVMFWLIFD